MRNYSSIVVMALLLLAPGTGCSTLTKPKPGDKKESWSISKLWQKEYQNPQELAALWSHDILAATGKAPTRGFGGRLFFYNAKKQPIPVKGELVVHGFEEKPGIVREYTTSSDKRFRFTAEQFTAHYSESDLGASYSVWIPWDVADGPRKEITLIPTFKSAEGQLIQGQAAKLVLPGRSSDGTIDQPQTIQTVSFQSDSPISPAAPGNNGGASKGSTSVTTINVKNEGAQRLLSGSYRAASNRPGEPTAVAATVNPQFTPEGQARVQAILDQLKMMNQPQGTNPQVPVGNTISPGSMPSANTNVPVSSFPVVAPQTTTIQRNSLSPPSQGNASSFGPSATGL